MTDAFIGEIRAMSFDYPPVRWLPCDGRALNMLEYQGLFDVIGRTYGGDIQKATFNVPDLRNRVVVGLGTQPKQDFTLGQGVMAGSMGVVLEGKNLPRHSHGLNGKVGDHAKSVNKPGGNWLGVPVLQTPDEQLKTRQGRRYQKTPTDLDVTLHPGTLMGAGVGNSHNNCQPVLTMPYFICYEGYMPLRS